MGKLADLTDEDLDIAPYGVQGPRCWYELLCEMIDDEDRAELDALLASREQHTVVSDKIRRAFSEELSELRRSASSPAVSGHRRGRCRCGTAL